MSTLNFTISTNSGNRSQSYDSRRYFEARIKPLEKVMLTFLEKA